METHIIISIRIGFITAGESEYFLFTCDEEGKMIGSLLRKLQTDSTNTLNPNTNTLNYSFESNKNTCLLNIDRVKYSTESLRDSFIAGQFPEAIYRLSTLRTMKYELTNNVKLAELEIKRLDMQLRLCEIQARK